MRQDQINLFASQWPKTYEIAATFRILRMVMEALLMVDPPLTRGIKDEGNSFSCVGSNSETANRLR